MRHTDQLAHTGVEAGAGGLGGKACQIHVVRGENLSRQPAGAAAAILPHILEDIGHLQALREGHGESGKLRAILRKLAQAGTSIIVVTHHLPDIIPEIGRVILIKKGRVLRDGPKRDVLKSGLLSELFETPVELVERDGLYQIW